MRARTIVPGSWLLGGPRYRWPTALSSGTTVAASLTLAANPDGPLSLRSPDGSLGGLVLPPTLATESGVIWLVDRREGSLRRFDPVTGSFATLPGWGARSGGAQAFGPRAAIAAGCGNLAIADPGRGDLVVVATGPMVVRAVLSLAGRRPVAVAAHAGRFHLLDDAGRLSVTSAAMDGLVDLPDPARPPDGSWRRVVVDRGGHTCRVDEVAGRLLAPATVAGWEMFDSPDAVRSRFEPPALVVDGRGRFRVPSSFRLTGSDDAAWFDADGDPCTIGSGEYAGQPPYEVRGWWTSRPFDSGELGCRWYRLTLTGSDPAGCTTTIETYTNDEPIPADEVPPDAWSPAHRIDHRVDGEGPASTDHAVLSPRGRHLVVRIGLRSDGWSTPSVDGLLVEPETAGLERFLPGVYRDDDADFLRRFLAIFGSELDAVELALRFLPGRFSPRAVPEELLDTLATELGVPLERSWSATQRRTMLAVAPRWHRRRGTPAAIRALLRTHLEATSGRSLPSGVPVLVEGFRERPASLVGTVRLPMGAGERTWSDTVVDRPVLGRQGADRIGLVSVGEPSTDRFRVHAHRFSVVLPRPLVPRRADRESLERLITAEKPAHVAHDLVLVEPRAVVGEQGSLGVDTYVGDWPIARLAAAGCGDGHALGFGLRLGGRYGQAPSPTSVGRGGRVGIGTVLV